MGTILFVFMDEETEVQLSTLHKSKQERDLDSGLPDPNAQTSQFFDLFCPDPGLVVQREFKFVIRLKLAPHILLSKYNFFFPMKVPAPFSMVNMQMTICITFHLTVRR
jgi:hypothetical protein